MKKAVVMFALVSTLILSITLPGLKVSVRAQSSDGWVLQWSHAYGGGGECQFAQPIGDIDKDGVNEIIVGGYEDIGRAHILSYNKSAGTYVEEYNWTYSVPGSYYTAPAGACVVDLDGDGNLEFAVAWSHSGPMGVYAYRWDGTALTTLDVYTGAGTDDLFDVYACDYDNDGRVEVLLANGPNAAGGGYHVAALGWDNARNKFLAEAFWKLAGYDSTMECPMVWSGDTDGDGKTEVIACISGNDSATAGTWALNWNVATRQWQELLVYNGLITGGTHYGVTVGDVDGDGTPEIGIGNNVVQRGAGACLFEWNGSTYRKVWEGSWPTEYPTVESVAIGDADNDGKQEFCVGGGHVHIIGWTGSDFGEKATITDTSGLLSGLNVGDSDTDGWNELKACDIFGVGPGEQWIFKHPPQKRQIANYKAVLVGMDYDTPPLHWYCNATAMRDTLLTWDCWRTGVIKLVGPNATRNDVIGNLSAMSVGPNDLFIFYYSGHGSFYNDKYYEPPPAVTPWEELLYASKYPRALIDDNLTDCFRKFDPNAEKVAILDCCYAGGFWNGSDEGDLERVQGTTLLASVPEDKQSPDSSDFTNALVQGMNRTTGKAPADADGDGEVTAAEWFNYAKQTVPTGPIYGYRKDEEPPLPPEEQMSFGNKTIMFNEPVAAGRLDLVVSSLPIIRGTIRIGLIGPIGLPQWSPCGMKEGAEMAAAEINAAGGVHLAGGNHQVVLYEEDEHSYPTPDVSAAVAAVDRLILEDGCQFIIGGFRTEVTDPMVVEADKYGVPFFIVGDSSDGSIVNTVGNPDLMNKGKYVFRISPVNVTTQFMTIAASVQYLVATKLLHLYGHIMYSNVTQVKAAVVMEDLAWTQSMYYASTNPAIYPDLLGPYVNITYKGRIPDGTTDCTPWVQGVKDSGARLLIHVFSGSTGASLIMQLRAMDVDVLPVGINEFAQLQTFWNMTSQVCEYESILCCTGTRVPVVAAPGQWYDTVTFWDSFVKKTGAWPIGTAFGTYDAMYYLKEFLEGSGTADRDALVTYMTNPSSVLMGLTGKFKFDSTHDAYVPATDIGVTWQQGYARPVIVQWKGLGIQQVVVPIDQVYSKKWAIPPWLYPLKVDINYDGKVDIIDIAATAKAFGTKPGDTRWDKEADVNLDNVIDIMDIAAIAKDFGKSLAIPLQ